MPAAPERPMTDPPGAGRVWEDFVPHTWRSRWPFRRFFWQVEDWEEAQAEAAVLAAELRNLASESDERQT